MLLAEKSALQELSWGSRSDGLFEAHKGAKTGAYSTVKIRPTETQVKATLLGRPLGSALMGATKYPRFLKQLKASLSHPRDDDTMACTLDLV